MNDQNETTQLRYLEETATRLRQNGFTVEPIEDHHLPVCWEKGRLCRVSGKGSVLYRQENVDSIRAQDALQTVIDIAKMTSEYPDKDIDNARVFARCGITPNLKFSTMDSLATYSMVEAGLGLAMNNALNGRAWSGGVRILPLDPPQIVEIGAATLPDLSPAARTFLDFLEPHLVEFLSEKS